MIIIDYCRIWLKDDGSRVSGAEFRIIENFFRRVHSGHYFLGQFYRWSMLVYWGESEYVEGVTGKWGFAVVFG
jgi:hypothetical protein